MIKRFFAWMFIFVLVGTVFYSSFAIAQTVGSSEEVVESEAALFEGKYDYGEDIGGSASFSGSSSSVSATTYQSQATYQPGYSGSINEGVYWPRIGSAETCEARQDIMLQVAPLGCQPAVVRSDLLAEQDVPVFCQINSIGINPLLEISKIQNIQFAGDYPIEVKGVGFYPAKAALKDRGVDTSSSFINNVGYVVVILKRNPIEKDLPESINVTLNAVIEYSANNAYGVGRSEVILEEVGDTEWESEKLKSSFWNGRYSVRLDEAGVNDAVVSIYRGDTRIVTQRVGKGETSSEIYVPGMYCQAGLKISYVGFVSAGVTAKIQVSDSGLDSFDVYEGGKFLDDRCIVKKIVINDDGETGQVVGSCGGNSFNLVLKQRGAVSFDSFVADGKSKVPEETSEEKWQINLEGNKIVSHSAIFELDKDNQLSKFVDGETVLLIDYTNKYGESVSDADKDWYLELKNDLVNYKTEKENNPTFDSGAITDRPDIPAGAMRYFNEAVDSYERVALDYPNELKDNLEGSESYGEAALMRAIDLAKEFGLDNRRISLINTFVETYSDSALADSYLAEVENLYRIDSSAAGERVKFGNSEKTFRLVSLNEPDKKTKADFLSDNKELNIGLKQMRAITLDGRKMGEVRVDVVNPDDVRVSAYCVDSNGNLSTTSRSYTFTIGDEREVCGVQMVLLNSDTKVLSKIKITPVVRGSSSESNFTVFVGIEKRAIQLSPNKIQEKIDRLNKSIEKWENIVDKLGKVVTGMKGACFATAAILTFKNFLGGLDGESLARQEVMNGDEGWRNRCSDMVSDGLYSSPDECYYKNANLIDSDVSARANAIAKVNAKIQAVQDKYVTSSGLLGTSQGVDSKKVNAELAQQIRNDYGETIVDVSNNPWVDESGNAHTEVAIKDILTDKNIANEVVTSDGLRSLALNAELKNSGATGAQLEMSDSRLQEATGMINQNVVIERELERSAQAEKGGFASPFFASSNVQRERVAEVATLTNNVRKQVPFSESIGHTSSVVVTGSSSDGKDGSSESFTGGKYILGLGESDAISGKYGTQEVYYENKVTGNYEKMDAEKVPVFLDTYGIGTIKSVDRISYNNEIKLSDRKVKYYETEPYRGMPAIVPFDVRQGWYAATKQTLPVLGGIGAYDASGAVTSFWLCNVGENKKIEFETGFGDDLCQMINLNTGQPLGSFPGKTESEAKTLVTKARQAIEDAANQYGNNYVTVAGERMEVGKPSSGQPGTTCQDFMSPSDCNLMFNICDPVICPASRCDFGGTYPVADVIQTGIIGSVLLCLPNIREGIFIPVCLTGIHAGIDALVSIMRNYRDCLQESLDTGEMVGICDEIYSIYLCEFFWNEFAPLISVLIPKMIEMAYGQGVRGGSEYLTVAGAWSNMENSVNYFTNSYAVNSMQAFQAKGVEGVGTEICKAFVSAKSPTAFESLIEPESPPQFHAWFDSHAFTDATVPATSQYKVFYHIYSGNDLGTSFNVYLRNPAESSYYNIPTTYAVDSGYVVRGEYASETLDFTAPEGYKELCVRINGDEHCGFGKVTSSFAVNYVSDAIVADQIATTNIMSESECISGSSSVGSLLNPNIQAGVSDLVNPAVYEKGIVRICSSQNPGLTTDLGRFVDVGYCDDSKIRCWLDKESVDNAISSSNIGIKDSTLEELEQNVNAMLENDGLLLDEASALGEIQDVESALVELEKSPVATTADELDDRIDFVFDRLLMNNHKARLLFAKGQVNKVMASYLLPEVEKEEVEISDTTLTDSSSSTTSTTPTADTNGNAVIPASENVKDIIKDSEKQPIFDNEGRLKIEFDGGVGSYGLNLDDEFEYLDGSSWINIESKFSDESLSANEKEWLAELKSELVELKADEIGPGFWSDTFLDLFDSATRYEIVFGGETLDEIAEKVCKVEDGKNLIYTENINRETLRVGSELPEGVVLKIPKTCKVAEAVPTDVPTAEEVDEDKVEKSSDISVQIFDGGENAGNGFLVQLKDGEIGILTANHVIENALTKNLEFVFSENSDEKFAATIIGVSNENNIKDVALLRTSLSSSKYSTVEFVSIFDFESMKIGDELTILGRHPLQGEIVEEKSNIINFAKVEDDGVRLDFEKIVIDSSLSEGFSGSPVFNANHKVVGIVSYSCADETYPECLAAIPTYIAQELFSDYLDSEERVFPRQDCFVDGIYLAKSSANVGESVPMNLYIDGKCENWNKFEVIYSIKDVPSAEISSGIQEITSQQKLSKYIQFPGKKITSTGYFEVRAYAVYQEGDIAKRADLEYEIDANSTLLHSSF